MKNFLLMLTAVVFCFPMLTVANEQAELPAQLASEDSCDVMVQQMVNGIRDFEVRYYSMNWEERTTFLNKAVTIIQNFMESGCNVDAFMTAMAKRYEEDGLSARNEVIGYAVNGQHDMLKLCAVHKKEVTWAKWQLNRSKSSPVPNVAEIQYAELYLKAQAYAYVVVFDCVLN